MTLIRTTLSRQDQNPTAERIDSPAIRAARLRAEQLDALDRLLNWSADAWFNTTAKSLTMSRKIAGHDVSTTVTSLNDAPYRTWKLDGEASSYSEIRRVITA